LLAHLNLQGRVLFPDRYDNFSGMPPDFLTLIYNAADVLMACSMSEGFGIPIVEAQACGTPVVTTDFSAMPELVRWGYTVQVADWVWTPMNSYQAWPDVKDMQDKLERLYDAWEVCGGDWPMQKRIATQNAIHAEYDWDAIVRDQWAPLMAQLAEDAPPLGERFQAQGVSVPKPALDEVQEFVQIVNDGLAQDKPKRRVAPLTNGHAIYAADEEAQVPA